MDIAHNWYSSWSFWAAVLAFLLVLVIMSVLAWARLRRPKRKERHTDPGKDERDPFKRYLLRAAWTADNQEHERRVWNGWGLVLSAIGALSSALAGSAVAADETLKGGWRTAVVIIAFAGAGFSAAAAAVRAPERASEARRQSVQLNALARRIENFRGPDGHNVPRHQDGRVLEAIVDWFDEIHGAEVPPALQIGADTEQTHDGQMTAGFSKALEDLGSEQMYVRIGGVFALEQIAQDAPDRAPHATQILIAFLQQRAPRRSGSIHGRLTSPWRARRRSTTASTETPGPLPKQPEADVQAAMTALTRSGSRQHIPPTQPLDLSNLHLSGAHLSGADLTGADLTEADLTDAYLAGADLTGADLAGADLTGADLTEADLSEVRGLTAEQVLTAHLARSTGLPADLRTDPAVLARID